MSARQSSSRSRTCTVLASVIGVVVQLATVGAAGAQAGAFVDTTSLASRTLGLTVAASGGPRDTLGLLVAIVTRDGPADQAGITSGSRILAINGQPVRLEPNEIGQRAAADTAMTRFERAVRANASGTDVTLRVIGGGRTRTVSLPMRVSAPAQSTDSVAPRSPFGLQTATPSAPVAAPVTAPGSIPVTAPLAAPVTAPVAAPSAASPSVAVATTAASGTSSATTANATAVSTLDTLATRLGDLQLDVRRAARESRSIAMSDSLSDIDQAIAQVRRRLRALAPDSASHVQSEATTTRPTSSAPAPATTSPAAAATAPATTAAPAILTAPATPAVTAPASAPLTTPRPDSPAIAAASTATSARVTISGLELSRVSTDLAAYLGGTADSGLLVVRASEEWEPMRAGDIVLQMDGAAPELARLRNAYDAHAVIRLLVLRRGRTFTLSFGDGAAR